MDFLDTLLTRNARFAAADFSPELKMMPSTGTVVVGCVDPRGDPAEILALEPGEVAVIRNVGGRVNKPLLETLGILRVVAKAAGSERGVRNLILLHHSDCGIIGCQTHAPDLLARHLGVETEALEGLAIADPRKAVAYDIAVLKANPQLPQDLQVTGLVYDVKTRLIDVVVPPTALGA